MWEVNLRVILGQSEGLFSVEQVLNSVKQVSKTVLNSVKQVSEQCKTQSNGRVKPLHPEFSLGTLNSGCVLRPLGSPTACSKRSYVHVPVVTRTRGGTGLGADVGAYRVGIQGGYTGWV